MRELLGPPLPPIAQHAWNVFDELHARRTISADGIWPIKHSEIESYCNLSDDRLTGLDLVLVCTIDDAYVASIANAMAPDEPDAPPSPES